MSIITNLETEIHYFEAGRRGKPDERDTNLANAIAAYFRTIIPLSRFDIRPSGRYESESGSLVVDISGEVSAEILDHHGLKQELTELVADDFKKVERIDTEPDLEVRIGLNRQDSALAANNGAGDSGTAIAVACANVPLNLPFERYAAVFIRDIIDNTFQNYGKVPAPFSAITGIERIDWLRSDGKISVEAEYLGGELLRLTEVVIAVQHDKCVGIAEVRNKIAKLANACLDILQQGHWQSLGRPKVTVNNRGPFVNGGWYTDAGSREAKPYRDGFSSHGATEDSFSGEDPSKPSATLTLVARNAACWIVQAGYAKYAKVTASIAIGGKSPRLHVYTNGTLARGLAQKELNRLANTEVWPLRLADAIKEFKLGKPETYELIRRTSDYFQNPDYPWNGKVNPARANI